MTSSCLVRKNAFLVRHFMLQNANIYQGRLGTNIGKVEKKRCVFGNEYSEIDKSIPFRPMFKLQFFRTSNPAPANATEEEAAADEAEMKEAFSATGASPGQQSIWRSNYRWLRGLPPSSTSDTGGGGGEGGQLESLAAVRKTPPFLSPFLYLLILPAHFTKTGSGQICRKLRIEVFLRRS